MLVRDVLNEYEDVIVNTEAEPMIGLQVNGELSSKNVLDFLDMEVKDIRIIKGLYKTIIRVDI